MRPFACEVHDFGAAAPNASVADAGDRAEAWQARTMTAVRARSAILLGLVACAACGDASTGSDPAPDVGADTGLGGFDVSTQFDGHYDPFDVSWDSPWGDGPADAPSAPTIRCGSAADGGSFDVDAAFCDPPPSVCADDWWLVYFTDGRCVRGLCTFDRRALFCNGGCRDGGCLPGPTAK